MCKICYNHDIVEELKNNHYYVCQAITFYIVLSMGGGYVLWWLTFYIVLSMGGGYVLWWYCLMTIINFLFWTKVEGWPFFLFLDISWHSRIRMSNQVSDDWNFSVHASSPTWYYYSHENRIHRGFLWGSCFWI